MDTMIFEQLVKDGLVEVAHWPVPLYHEKGNCPPLQDQVSEQLHNQLLLRSTASAACSEPPAETTSEWCHCP